MQLMSLTRTAKNTSPIFILSWKLEVACRRIQDHLKERSRMYKPSSASRVLKSPFSTGAFVVFVKVVNPVFFSACRYYVSQPCPTHPLCWRTIMILDSCKSLWVASLRTREEGGGWVNGSSKGIRWRGFCVSLRLLLLCIWFGLVGRGLTTDFENWNQATALGSYIVLSWDFKGEHGVT